jgi:hypothetical protein
VKVFISIVRHRSVPSVFFPLINNAFILVHGGRSRGLMPIDLIPLPRPWWSVTFVISFGGPLNSGTILEITVELWQMVLALYILFINFIDGGNYGR